MQDFIEWLVTEKRRELVPLEVLDGYERGFRKALMQLLGKVTDPLLRTKFERMLECPIQDAQGRCHSFTDYILGALVRAGIHRQADLEDVLSYIYQTMMFDRKVTGAPKATIFGGFDADRAWGSEGNPLEARFKTSVGNAIRNIAGGRIPRLLNVERRPQGTISIGQGRGATSGSISYDEIPGRSEPHADLGELVGDIKVLLHRKEAAYGLPLNGLFHAIMAGQRVAEQRKRFGDRVARAGRQIIVGTIREYAESSGNHYLLQLLQRLEEPDEVPNAKTVMRPANPVFSSMKDKDYSSILQVVDRMGRPTGTADLGRYRRRWLEYPPRDASSDHPNRMAEVLGQMVRDGALQTVQTGRGAVAYAPGPNAESYRKAMAV